MGGEGSQKVGLGFKEEGRIEGENDSSENSEIGTTRRKTLLKEILPPKHT